MWSNSTLFGEISQLKCSHFSMNPRNWEFRTRTDCVKIQVSKQVQVCHMDSQHWPTENYLVWKWHRKWQSQSTVDNGPNLSQIFTEILLVWPHIYSQICLRTTNNCCIEPSRHPWNNFFDNLIYINNKDVETIALNIWLTGHTLFPSKGRRGSV